MACQPACSFSQADLSQCSGKTPGAADHHLRLSILSKYENDEVDLHLWRRGLVGRTSLGGRDDTDGTKQQQSRIKHSHVQNACNCLALVDLFYPEFVIKISCQI